MQKLRELLALCLSFRGTIAPKPYVIGSLIVMALFALMTVSGYVCSKRCSQ